MNWLLVSLWLSLLMRDSGRDRDELKGEHVGVRFILGDYIEVVVCPYWGLLQSLNSFLF